MKGRTSLNPHLCPDCVVPISECGWWKNLTPPEGAKTGIRQISEYAKGRGHERVPVDRVIVVECPNFTNTCSAGMKKGGITQEQANSYDALAKAIILTAVKDYRAAKSGKIREIRRFFRSDLFTILCDLDGETLIKKLDEETKNDKT